MQIRDRGLRAAYQAAIQDGKLDQKDAQALIDSAKDGNMLSKTERKDLERILTSSTCQIEGPAKQAILNFLNGLTRCESSDLEPAPTPRVRTSMAFERAEDGATFVPNSPPASRPAPARFDPVYIEVDNVELGSHFEIINLSAKPDAQFDRKNDVVKLELTGRDIQNRRASVYLTHDQMEQFGIKPGDVFQLRAVDHNGNPSLPVTAEFEPDDWRTGRIQERDADGRATLTPGMQLNALDGENVRKNLLIKTVNDSRPPLLIEEKLVLTEDARFDENDKDLATQLAGQWNALVTQNKALHGHNNAFITFEEMTALAGSDKLNDAQKAMVTELISDKEVFQAFDGAYGAQDNRLDANCLNAVRSFNRTVTLNAFAAIEPRSTVTVQNQRTGESKSVTIGDDRMLTLNLGDVRNGDPLILTPVDNEGQTGKEIELVFSAGCKDGKAPKVTGGLGARLPGVI